MMKAFIKRVLIVIENNTTQIKNTAALILTIELQRHMLVRVANLPCFRHVATSTAIY